VLGGRVVRLKAWVFEEKHSRLAHDGVAHDRVAGHVVAAGVVCAEAENGLVEVATIVRLRVLVGLLSLLLLVLLLARSARNGLCDCGGVEGVLTFTLACLEEDDTFGDVGNG
jgi:hypothetical protein